MTKLKQMRYAKGVSQCELAKFVGVSRQTISYIENGKNGECSWKTAERICQFFSCTPFEILDVGMLLRFEPRNADEAKTLINMIEEKYVA